MPPFRTLVLAVGLTAVAALGTPATGQSGSSSIPEKVPTYGQPKQFDPGAGTMYALWFEDGVWKLRMTAAKNTKAVFTGRIQAEGGKMTAQIQGLEKAKKAKDADWVVPLKDATGFDFRFTNGGGSDGVDFKVTESTNTIVFKLLVDGGEVTKRVLIGKKGDRPAKIPFTLPAKPTE